MSETDPSVTPIHRKSMEYAPKPRNVIDNINQIAASIPDAMMVAGGGELKELIEAARNLAATAEAAFEIENNLS